jgi:pimeloyl-ACP methyl ester carboxylesterase
MKLIRFLTMLALFAGAPLGAIAQTPSDSAGDWRGTLSAGAVKIRVALHLGAASSFDSPDQGALGLPARMTSEGRRVTVTVEKVGVFDGELSEDGSQLVGALVQGPTRTPLTLERGVFAAANRPQTPTGPFPYESKEARYDNPQRPGVHLAGTLTVPAGPGPFPTVLLITGSGAQDRDETLFEHKPFLVLADHLTRQGVAVLRVDDRGVGGSTGASANDTTADFATDVEAGIAWLKTRSEIDSTRIGLLGHSEGGAIAPLVASRDPSIAFVVLWAGPGVSGADIIVEQVRAISVASGAPAAEADRSAHVQRAVMDAVLKAPDAEAVRAAVIQVLADHGAPTPGETSLRQLASPWYRHFIAFDPAPVLRAVKAPVLALLGGKDVQVTASQNMPALQAALRDNPDAQVIVLPNLNHLFQTAITGSVSEYGKNEETIAPEALRTIGDWIVARTAR